MQSTDHSYSNNNSFSKKQSIQAELSKLKSDNVYLLNEIYWLKGQNKKLNSKVNSLFNKLKAVNNNLSTYSNPIMINEKAISDLYNMYMANYCKENRDMERTINFLEFRRKYISLNGDVKKIDEFVVDEMSQESYDYYDPYD